MVIAMAQEPLMQRLESEASDTHRWSNGPGDRYVAHLHRYEKVVYCEAGSITFHLPDQDREIHLGPGERMVLAAGTRHSALVGPGGCVCIEGRR
jgi:quercetin dioxygenase-like cupin family protein